MLEMSAKFGQKLTCLACDSLGYLQYWKGSDIESCAQIAPSA